MTSSTITAAAPDEAALPRVLALRTIHEGWGRFQGARLLAKDGTEILREVSGSVSILETPAGRPESPDPSACAAREAFVECGVVLGRLDVVVTASSMPAMSTERIHLCLAPFRATTAPAAASPTRE